MSVLRLVEVKERIAKVRKYREKKYEGCDTEFSEVLYTIW